MRAHTQPGYYIGSGCATMADRPKTDLTPLHTTVFRCHPPPSQTLAARPIPTCRLSLKVPILPTYTYIYIHEIEKFVPN